MRRYLAEVLISLNDFVGTVLRLPSRTQAIYNAPFVVPGSSWAAEYMRQQYAAWRTQQIVMQNAALEVWASSQERM